MALCLKDVATPDHVGCIGGGQLSDGRRRGGE